MSHVRPCQLWLSRHAFTSLVLTYLTTGRLYFFITFPQFPVLMITILISFCTSLVLSLFLKIWIIWVVVLLLSCVSWLYILYITSWSDDLQLSFRHSVGCLLCWSFLLWYRNFLVWRSQLALSLFFFFVACDLGVVSHIQKNHCLELSRSFSPCFLLGVLWFPILHFSL